MVQDGEEDKIETKDDKETANEAASAKEEEGNCLVHRTEGGEKLSARTLLVYCAFLGVLLFTSCFLQMFDTTLNSHFPFHFRFGYG